MATKRVLESLEKMATDMATQKAACHKALDERERSIDQIKHLQDDSTRDAADFDSQVEMLKRDSEELDYANSNKEHVLEAASELEKRKLYATMRSSRAEREKLEVRYGYLRSQLEGIDSDFLELQRIVGVHFVPSHPESLQQIIETFVEKEQRVASLQTYWTLQNDEVEDLSSQLSTLEALAKRAEADADKEGASASASTGKDRQRASEEEVGVVALTQVFDVLCSSLERAFVQAGCAEDPTLKNLATKGCSLSTIHDFLAALAARVDDVSRKAYSLRQIGQAVAHRSSGRTVPEAIGAFLKPRGGNMPQSATEGAAGDEGGAVDDSGLNKDSLKMKENLPSISDIAQETEGETELAEGRRRAKNELRKGGIDREKRDTAISAWVTRQHKVRGAQTARPTIREYYAEDAAEWPQRSVYPPASAR